MFPFRKVRSQSMCAQSFDGESHNKKHDLLYVPGRQSRSRSASNMDESVDRSHRLKSILKVVTADDSLHMVYGAASKTDSETSITTSESSLEDFELASHHQQQQGQQKPRRSSVTFHHIEIREYAITVGDNPSCSSGPPITITWDYDPDIKVIGVDQYEQGRPPRRRNNEMMLPSHVRSHLLRKEWQVPRTEIAAAMRAYTRTRFNQRVTRNNAIATGADVTNRMEEILESAGRKVKKGLGLRRNVTQQVQELERQMKRAQAARARAIFFEADENEYNHNTDDKSFSRGRKMTTATSKN